MKRKLRKYNAYYDPDIKHVAEIDLFINLIGTQVKKMIGIWNGTAIFLGVIEPNPIIDFWTAYCNIIMNFLIKWCSRVCCQSNLSLQKNLRMTQQEKSIISKTIIYWRNAFLSDHSR